MRSDAQSHPLPPQSSLPEGSKEGILPVSPGKGWSDKLPWGEQGVILKS